MTRLVSAIYNDAGPFLNINNVNSFEVSSNADDLTTKDILLLHGGEDISPSLYNHPVSEYTGATKRPSRRDSIEWSMLQRAIELGIPIVGICRGAQMLCAAAGGYLIQHVDNHSGDHIVETSEGDDVVTNSCHHQMMYPFDVDHELLMWTKYKRSGRHITGFEESINVPCEPEAVFFPKIKGFAPQWHPEWMSEQDPAVLLLLKQINERI